MSNKNLPTLGSFQWKSVITELRQIIYLLTFNIKESNSHIISNNFIHIISIFEIYATISCFCFFRIRPINNATLDLPNICLEPDKKKTLPNKGIWRNKIFFKKFTEHHLLSKSKVINSIAFNWKDVSYKAQGISQRK